MTKGRARGQILDISKKCYFILLTYVDILSTLTIFVFGTCIMHGWLPLNYFSYMVTCKSSKSRISLDYVGHGKIRTGTEKTSTRGILASQDTFASC